MIDYARLAERAVDGTPPSFDEAVALIDGHDVELLHRGPLRVF